ncbi:MAG: ribonuclease III [Deltaproteobacteria bacterium]|nr:ribonuclease III [Deltaproteobacteria bacterium]
MDRGVPFVTAKKAPDVELARLLGHTFFDAELLERALTHPSSAYERDGSRGNERLEFLGDAVLDLVMAHLLYDAHPDWREGDLTRARAAMVNTESLAARARELGLGEYIRLGRTELQSGGAEKNRVLANLLEAVIGGLYLDAGIEKVFSFTERAFAEPLASGSAVLEQDPKTRFQEWAHAALKETPRYEPLADSGEEHSEDRFLVAALVGEERWGEGKGRTKRAAERAAASAALDLAAEREAADG